MLPAAGRGDVACALAHSRCRSGCSRCPKAIATFPIPVAFEVRPVITAPVWRCGSRCPASPEQLDVLGDCLYACLVVSFFLVQLLNPSFEISICWSYGLHPYRVENTVSLPVDNCSRSSFLSQTLSPEAAFYQTLSPEKLIATKSGKMICICLQMACKEQFLGQIGRPFPCPNQQVSSQLTPRESKS